MKKTILVIFIFLIGSSVFAQLDLFMPPHPITFGMGGAFTADPAGITSFFYNPAGFASEEGEMTITSATVYALFDPALVPLIEKLLNGAVAIPSPTTSARQSPPTPPGGGIPGGFAGLLPEGLLDLANQLSGVSNWLNELEGAEKTAATSAAVRQLIELDEGLADLLPDPDNAEEIGNLDQQALIEAFVDSPILEENEETQNSNLVEILDAMNEAAAAAAAEEGRAGDYEDIGDSLGTTDGTDWKTSLNSTVKKSRESMPGGSIRLGGLVSVAYAGNGFGVGLFVGADAPLNGKTLLSTKGRVVTNISLAGGFAIPIGPFTIGAQIRPMLLGYTDINPIQALLKKDPALLIQGTVYTGIYVGVDVGALLDLSPFTLGLAIKDILPLPVQWSSYNGFTEYLTGLSQFQPLGTGTVSAEEQKTLYQIPPLKVNFGVKFHPDFATDVIDWKINADIQDVFGFIRYLEYNPHTGDKATLGDGYDFLDYLHVGTELSFLDGLAAVRAGFGDGFLSAGLGLDLWILDINVAGGLSDLRENAQGNLEFKQAGFSIEVALRL